jgi:hypothetical protein
LLRARDGCLRKPGEVTCRVKTEQDPWDKDPAPGAASVVAGTTAKASSRTGRCRPTSARIRTRDLVVALDAGADADSAVDSAAVVGADSGGALAAGDVPHKLPWR